MRMPLTRPGSAPAPPTPPASVLAASSHAAAFILTAALFMACGDLSNTPAPTPTGGLVVMVFAPHTLYPGEPQLATLRAWYGPGTSGIVSNREATWASSDTSVLTVTAEGEVAGVGQGTARLTATYRGVSGWTDVTVTAVDWLRNFGGSALGPLWPGSSFTLVLVGIYHVGSAESGRIYMRLSDQAGVITTTAPITLARGIGHFEVGGTFTIPQASSRICGAAILEVGSFTVSASGPIGPQQCFAIVPRPAPVGTPAAYSFPLIGGGTTTSGGRTREN